MNLCTLITNRDLIEFHYDGHHRIVLPAAHGLHAQSGNAAMRGYQIEGTSNSRPVPFWSMFLVAKMHGVSVLARRHLAVPPGFQPGDEHIVPLCCELRP